ncbi:MAG TPA: 1-acyl-sn-glycerol-3-phosphate acyltransferase [Moraxellaceae bacterium]|nr:1-acyl-sn-glycerol-3-phosphate acyltransferase [Moraxellaceae bacterium]
MTDSRFIDTPPLAPQRGGPFVRWFARLILRLMRWRITGTLPNIPRAVLISAPHTSNQDGFLTAVSSIALGLHTYFLVKHTAFVWPLRRLLTAVGALPVDRANSKNLVSDSAKRIRESDSMWLAIAPEGTRTATAWKTGFYWIAVQAGVPILLIAFDYAKRETMVLGTFEPTGDIEKDMPALMERYRDISPRHPDRLSPAMQALRASERPQ